MIYIMKSSFFFSLLTISTSMKTSLLILFHYFCLAFILPGCGIVFNKDASGTASSEASETDDPRILVTVGDSNDDDFSSIKDALIDGRKNIFVNNGIYQLDQEIIVSTDGTKIVGESADGVQIIQTDPEKDLLVIRADNVTIETITLDTQTNNAQAALVEGGGSGILIKNNIIKGGNKIFALFFAGPPVSSKGANIGQEEKDETMDVYLENGESQFDFSTDNEIVGNYISSEFLGDGISFSVQKNGLFHENIIEGAMISVYLCKDTVVKNNTITNSLQHGIFLTLPSENVTLYSNTISAPRYNGIHVQPQYQEHGYINEGIITSGIEIKKNIIKANLFGINVEGHDVEHQTWGDVRGVGVSENEITQFDFIGVRLVDVKKVDVVNNVINFENCDDSTRGNTFTDGGEIPNVSDRDSAGIYLLDQLDEISINGNSLNKGDSCDAITVMQNALTISHLDIVGPRISEVSITNNHFKNKVGDWMHSNSSLSSTSELDGIDFQQGGITVNASDNLNEVLE